MLELPCTHPKGESIIRWDYGAMWKLGALEGAFALDQTSQFVSVLLKSSIIDYVRLSPWWIFLFYKEFGY